MGMPFLCRDLDKTNKHIIFIALPNRQYWMDRFRHIQYL
jgi:hypothetical protein